MSARLIAVEVLARVERQGIFPEEALEEAFRFNPHLPLRERAFAREVVSGVLRWQGRLDHLLAQVMARPLPAKNALARNALRAGLYQCRHMRVPCRAAVDESVKLVKGGRERHLAGLVNAVLRKAAELDETAVLARSPDPVESLALTWSHPLWLVRRWLSQVGRDKTEARLSANQDMPPLTLRVHSARICREDFLAALKVAGIQAVPTRAPGGVIITPGMPVKEIPGFGQGWFAVQDEASQRVALLLDPQPGERILEACAAPGGKTAHLYDLTQGKAHLTALDNNPARLARLRENFARLGVEGVEVVEGDGAQEGLLAGRTFARILIDAPCTATGIIRRHPEIKWRRQEADIHQAAQLQRRILANLAPLLNPGGVLVYGVCSLEPEEGEEVVASFLKKNPGWVRQEGVICEPGEEGMDGFFAVRLVRGESA